MLIDVVERALNPLKGIHLSILDTLKVSLNAPSATFVVQVHHSARTESLSIEATREQFRQPPRVRNFCSGLFIDVCLILEAGVPVSMQLPVFAPQRVRTNLELIAIRVRRRSACGDSGRARSYLSGDDPILLCPPETVSVKSLWNLSALRFRS